MANRQFNRMELQSLSIRNFRNISKLDLNISSGKNIICLVGPNGSGKSSLLSLLVSALCELTHETAPDIYKESVLSGHPAQEQSNNEFVNRQKWSTSEIGPEGPAYGYSLEVKSNDKTITYELIVQLIDVLDRKFIENLGNEINIAPPPPSELFKKGWKNKPSKSEDPIARSVFLFRPSDRFEIPQYEERFDQSYSPTTAENWIGKRLLPIKCKTGLHGIESLILDLALDSKLGNELSEKLLNKIINAIQLLRSVDDKIVIPPWPLRRVGVGQLNALSLLSAGELDFLVTVGQIVAQQAYLSRKFPVPISSDEDNFAPGIVFIDEIDAHLHPKWQEIILPNLMKLFPNITFVVAVHSPFVLRSLPVDNSIVIRLPDGKIFEENFSAWRIDDILEIVYDVPSIWSKEINDRLKYFQGLVADMANEKEAIELYNSLSSRSSSLRSECDKIVALSAITELREKIRVSIDSAQEVNL